MKKNSMLKLHTLMMICFIINLALAISDENKEYARNKYREHTKGWSTTTIVLVVVGLLLVLCCCGTFAFCMCGATILEMATGGGEGYGEGSEGG